jgi:alpha-beta hydrolase superfamily lysophospholipase
MRPHVWACLSVKTLDGVEIFVRDWPLPAGARRRGSALIVHGLGEHCGRYVHVAAALNAIGIAVRGYDHRGFGQSGGPRAVLPFATAYLDDAKLMFDAFAADAGAAGDSSPPFVIGPSMGGAIAARAVTGGWIRPRGLVLSSPALKLPLPIAMRLFVRLAAMITPDRAQQHGIPLRFISRDPAVFAAVKEDPHCHDRATPRLVAFLIDAGSKARRDAAKLDVPTLLLVSGEDKLVDPDGSREFAAAMRPDRCMIKIYPALYHEIFNELEPDRAAVLADLCGWITKQLEDRSR